MNEEVEKGEADVFDRRLRGCVMDALSRIEVAVRVSAMENHAAMFKGDPFVYARRENFPRVAA